MAYSFILAILFVLGSTKSEVDRRLVLHSDLDLSQVIHELRQDISATKQENIALKAQLDQVNKTLAAQVVQQTQNLSAQITQEKQTLNDRITQEEQTLNARITQEAQTLAAQMVQQTQNLSAQITHESQTLTDQMAKENLALKTEIAQLKSGQGSTYVRWGRTVCEGNGTHKVYSGYAGGNGYNTEGGPSNVLCLPESPSWANYKDGLQNEGAYVYGGEYELVETNFNGFGRHMHSEDVPCVLCHSVRPSSVMIPGSTTCYPGWTLEFTGYLMATHNAHTGNGDYTCVDQHPEAVLHGEEYKGGHLFYFTEVQCGTLPCQTYPMGRELACVVCSK